jgi:hypothetical protein
MKTSWSGMLCVFAAGLILAAAPMWAQDVVLPPGGAAQGDATAVARDLPKVTSANTTTGAGPAPALPIWKYSVTSPTDSNTYTGYMVGVNPFNRGARTTTIPVILIPVIVNFHNTTSGFTTTFDPTSHPDAGCTGNQTAFSLVQNSPIFQNNPWTMNGASVGNTQYIDAFQRANFWQTVQTTGNAYHLLLSPTVGATLTITLNYASPSYLAEVFAVGAGTCTNAGGSGSTNSGTYTGAVFINTIDAQLQAYISAQGITVNQFPLFVMYNVVMPISSAGNFFDAGYHSSTAGYPAGLTSPAQTYGIADVQTNQFFSNAGLNSGTSILAHEVGEWVNDPGVYNATPAWGHIGQQSGCQNNLEVGDALTGTNMTGIAGPGGFTYYMQELVFYSWFFRIPATGAGGKFSNNGTFTTSAGAVCQ